MPRVHHVKSARKANPVAKKGEPYYWWKFRHGGKRYSTKPPRPSQLTQSNYLGTVRSIVESIDDASFSDFEEFNSFREDIMSQVQDLQGETQESLDNMPESLQYSPTGELLQERIDALSNAESELDSTDEFEFEEEEFDESDFDAEKDDIAALRESHQESEDSRREDEFMEWLDDAKAALVEAVSNLEV